MLGGKFVEVAEGSTPFLFLLTTVNVHRCEKEEKRSERVLHRRKRNAKWEKQKREK
jgi:hypothetical protein